MYKFRNIEQSRNQASLVSNLIDGKAWKARFVPNNNLRQHCRILAKTFKEFHELTEPLLPSAHLLFGRVSQASNLLTNVHPTDLAVVPALVRMAAYHAKWIRSPDSWLPEASATPRQQLNSLALHLFAKWKMPDWFGSAWLVKGDLFYLERDWYCHVAAGGSLRSVTGMPPSITSRALHLAYGAPDRLTVREALRWGQVKALGGSDDFLVEVLNSRIVRDLSNDAVWSRLMGKVIGTKSAKPGDFSLIADTLLEVIRNEDCGRAEALMGLPLSELLAFSRKFWKAVASTGSQLLPEVEALIERTERQSVRAELSHLLSDRWTKMPCTCDFRVSYQGENGFFHWRMEELRSQAQLIAEGRLMRHCVGMYRRKCQGERSSIFALRRHREEKGTAPRKDSLLTIEVDRQSRRIVQVRGRYNRRPFIEEWDMVRKWAAESHLKI
jgi:hypothetical protein